MSLAMTPVNVMRRSSEEAIAEYREYCIKMNNVSTSLAGKCDEKLWFYIGHFRWNLYPIGRATFWNQIPMFDVRNCANFDDVAHFLNRTGAQLNG